MGRLGFNNASSNPKKIERSGSYCECGGNDNADPTVIGIDDDDDDDDEDDEDGPISEPSGTPAGYEFDDYDEESMLDRNKHLRQPPPSKKVYLLYLMVTTAIVCFCFVMLVPQFFDYFNEPNVIGISNNAYSSQQSVIQLPDTERSPRNQERLEIMRRFDALQQKYRELQVEYKKAEEAYLKKLHSAIEEENLGSPHPEIKIVNDFAEPNEFEIYKLEDVEKINNGKNKNSTKVEKLVTS